MNIKWHRRFNRVKLWFTPITNEFGLNQILENLPAIESVSDRIRFFEELSQWLARDSETAGRYVRIRFLLQQLEKNSGLLNTFKIETTLLFKESSLLRLFLQTGFANQSGLLQEIGRRIVSKIIPSVRQNDFYELFNEVFQSEEQLVWFKEIPLELIQQMLSLFSDAEKTEIRLHIDTTTAEALLVLTSNLAFLALTNEIRERSKQLKPSDSPFLKLQIQCQKIIKKETVETDLNNDTSILILDCRKIIDRVYEDMEQNGTSIGLVYRLEVMSADLDRIYGLLNLSAVANAETVIKNIHEVFSDCAEATYSSESVIAHFHQQTHLLSRKIAERNGESGDHYIARNSQERRKLLFSALKGGVIVVLMTLVKLTLHSWHLPPLLDATCVWIVYSVGFLSMQFTDSTLATKLPSFTASKLARLMTTVRDSSGLSKITAELKTVLVSQGLAFFGNIMAVIPLALLLEFLTNYFLNSHLLDAHTAESTLQGLDPFRSLAILFGIITGVLLWISSIAGGWFENWIVFRKIPEAIRHHRRMNYVFGKLKSERVADWIEHNASGFSANIVLGFLFGFLPFVGTVTGIPLDSKHVTISSASAALSALTLPPNHELVLVLLWATLGLAFIGIANLLVSFTLALIVAARASSIDQRRFRALIRMLGRRLMGRS